MQSPAQVEYVDPNIGGVGYLLEPTRPTVSLPNSMLRFYPARWDVLDDQIQSSPFAWLPPLRLDHAGKAARPRRQEGRLPGWLEDCVR